MRHIVIITPIFAVDENDSITLPFLQLYCKELIKNKVSLSIITEQYPQSHNYIWNGIKVFTLKRNSPRLIWKFLRKRSLLKTLSFIHQEKKIDVIHNLWFNVLGLIAEKFSLQHNIKLLITLAGQDVLLQNPLLKHIQNFSGKLICVSSFHKQKLEEHFSVPVSVIEWGIEEIETNTFERTIDLIICGWINSVKNHGYFLEIVSELQKTNTLKKVVICGGGPMFDELVVSIQKKDLQHLIEIKNSIPREEVIELMQKSKILVHTSSFESFGLVLAEGLACSCKVISTPVGIAFDDTDIIRCSSKEEFVREIKANLSNYTHEHKTKANRYPISKTVGSYIELYKKF